MDVTLLVNWVAVVISAIRNPTLLALISFRNVKGGHQLSYFSSTCTELLVWPFLLFVSTRC